MPSLTRMPAAPILGEAGSWPRGRFWRLLAAALLGARSLGEKWPLAALAQHPGGRVGGSFPCRLQLNWGLTGTPPRAVFPAQRGREELPSAPALLRCGRGKQCCGSARGGSRWPGAGKVRVAGRGRRSRRSSRVSPGVCRPPPGARCCPALVRTRGEGGVRSSRSGCIVHAGAGTAGGGDGTHPAHGPPPRPRRCRAVPARLRRRR